jgi:hypothetical protein
MLDNDHALKCLKMRNVRMRLLFPMLREIIFSADQLPKSRRSHTVRQPDAAPSGWIRGHPMAASQVRPGSTEGPRHEKDRSRFKRRMPKPELISSWGAVVAAAATAIGLFFTAYSVKYQAQQTRDQNATNSMQVQDENKAQARLVNIWPTNEFSPNAILITVSNRSEEPVYEFRLYIAMIGPANGGYLAVGEWSTFPPCTQVTFDLRAIAMSYSATAKIMTSSHQLPRFDYGIMFTDALGQAWHRHASGTLHATPWLEYLNVSEHKTPVPPVFINYKVLSGDLYTTPEVHQLLVSGSPVTAQGCDTGV